jgi:hypothetical protein
MVILTEKKSSKKDKSPIQEVALASFDDVVGLGGFNAYFIFDKSTGISASHSDLGKAEGGYGTIIRGPAMSHDDIALVVGQRKRVIAFPAANVKNIGLKLKSVIFYLKNGAEITFEKLY